MEEKYGIKPGGFGEVKNKLLFRSILLIAIIAAAIIYIFYSGEAPVDYTGILLTSVIYVVVFGIILFRSYSKTRKVFESYQLSIAGNVITRTQQNLPEATVYFHEIVAIEKFPKGMIMIKGKYKGDTIYVPAQIERYEDLLAKLENIHPVTNKNALPFTQQYWWVIVLVSLSLFAAFFTSHNVWIILVTGSLLIAQLVWTFIKISGNPNIEEKAKNRRWIFLLFGLFILARIIMSLVYFF